MRQRRRATDVDTDFYAGTATACQRCCSGNAAYPGRLRPDQIAEAWHGGISPLDVEPGADRRAGDPTPSGDQPGVVGCRATSLSKKYAGRRLKFQNTHAPSG